MKKRLFAIFLVLCLAVALLPMAALAEESGNTAGSTGQCTCDSTGHQWLNGVCQCESCDAVCDHSDSTEQPSCEVGDTATCTVCGGTITSTGHAWQNGQCQKCTATHDHAQTDWVNGVCDVCGQVCMHEGLSGDEAAVSAWVNGVCGVCGKVCTHEELSNDGAAVSAWVNGTCILCGLVCAHTQRNDDDTCAVCGISLEPEPQPVPTSAPTPAPTPVPHTHSYTSSVTTAAGCVTPGVRIYTCSCGAYYTEAIPATGHSYYLARNVEATCTTDGLREYTCSVCRLSYQERIPAGGHDWQGKFTVIDGNTNAGGSFRGYVYTCLSCGESYRESMTGLVGGVGSGLSGLRDNTVTLVGANVQTGGIHKMDNLSVEGTIVYEDGTGYVVTENLVDGTERIQGVTIESDEENIRYLAYLTQGADGNTKELLQFNASQGLGSLSIDIGTGTDGQSVYTVRENGELLTVDNITVDRQDNALSVTVTGESGSQIDYTQPVAGKKDFSDWTIGDLSLGGDSNNGVPTDNSAAYSGDLTGPDGSSWTIQPVDSGSGVHVIASLDSGAAGEPDSELADVLAENGMQGTLLQTQDGGVLVPGGATLTLSGGDSGGDTTISGGVLEPKEVQSGDLSAGDEATPTPTPTATPEPDEDEEETVSGWVEIVFSTEDLSEPEPTPTPEATIAPATETPAPAIAPAATDAPKVIQKFVDPTPTPTPAPTPTPTPKVQWSFSEAQTECPKCGKFYYPSQGHQCKSAWKEFGDGMKEQIDDMVDYVEEKGCVPSGTLITLADGTQKPVEEVTEDDLLLVYDHEAGTFTTATINFIERNEAALSTVVTLSFSDGSETALVYEHAYFDLDEMRYVFLTAENAKNYTGHRFYKAEIVDGVYTPVAVELVDVTVAEKVVASYDFPTKYHLNFFADGFLSMPAETAGLTNFFEYDENLAYNAESMTAAIGKYGLLEYADLAAWLTEEEFVSYPARYLAVNLGNGTLTQEELIELIETYVHEYR